MKLIVGITGASGVKLAIKFLTLMPKDITIFAILSSGAKKTLALEEGLNLPNDKHITYFDDTNLASSISSGSFQTDAYIIVPCSMNTLAKCSVGISDNLITRVFSVMLKENRDIVIAPREMPYNTIQLENMTKLSNLGVTIAPPVLGYYSKQQTLDDMENFIIGKWFDILKIKHNLYKRWE
ncbi:MAG: UbiX family flavin prenyltransferase [Campylobacterota bacterium]|nr:UbiX family flavin prenyltransferase [Campylobacterota bacterium]